MHLAAIFDFKVGLSEVLLIFLWDFLVRISWNLEVLTMLPSDG